MTSASASADDGGGPGRWAGIPADERRAERRRLLLDAAFELLGEGGADALTVRAVCKGARLNPRYFYESFDDRGELLVGLYDEVAKDLASAVAARLPVAPADLADGARIGIDTVFRFVAEDPRRAKVLYTEVVGDEALVRRRAGTVDQFIAALSRGTSPVIDVVTASMFAGGMVEILTGWVSGRIELSLDELIDAAVALALRVLQPPT